MISLVFIALLSANPVDLDAAERSYRAGRFEEALALYERAQDEPGFAKKRGAILYDIGNCYFRLNRPADALHSYLRAERRLPHDGEVAFNRRLAENRLRLDAEELGGGASIIGAFTPGEFLALTSGLLAASLTGFVLARRRRGVRAATGFAALVALAGAAWLVATEYLPGPPEGVVLPTEIALRAEPNDGAAVTGSLRAGERVTVEEVAPRWVRITHGSVTSWTERKGVGIVD